MIFPFGADEDGLWEFCFGNVTAEGFTITVDPIDGYTIEVDNANAPVFQIFASLIVAEDEKLPAELNEEPTALDLTYTGEEQTLIEAGNATGGELMYALGTDDTTAPTDGYSTELPVGTEAGTYYVWYYVKGDAMHKDTEKQCLDVKVKEHYFMRHSLSLDGDIGVNFYLKLTEDDIDSGATVNFELNGEPLSTYTVDKTWDKNTVDGMTLYKATCQVCAPEMADTITATLSIGDEAVETDTYSVRTYGDTFLTDETKQQYLDKGHTEDEYNRLANLVQTMLNYGAATQIQFAPENAEYNPNNDTTHSMEDLANANIDYDLVPLTEAEIDAINTSAPDKSTINAALEGSGFTYYGYTMLLHSNTKLRFYFQKDTPNLDCNSIQLDKNEEYATSVYTAKSYNDYYVC